MDKFKPFADNETSFQCGGLSAENGEDRIAIYGNLDLTRDKVGLAQARALKGLFETVVRTLEAESALPEALAPLPAPQTAQTSSADTFDLPTGGLAKP